MRKGMSFILDPFQPDQAWNSNPVLRIMRAMGAQSLKKSVAIVFPRHISIVNVFLVQTNKSRLYVCG